jgi:8-oxo-dGTP diphosphatase
MVHAAPPLGPIPYYRQHREGGIVSSDPVSGLRSWYGDGATYHDLFLCACYDAGMSSPADLPRRQGVVAVVMRGDKFLVIRRSQHVRAPGMHCFPGGAIEPGETEFDAVCRELSEELAVIATPQRLLWRSVTSWNVELAWWLVEVDPAAEPIANPLEVESFHWLSAAEIRGLTELLASNVEFLDAWESGCLTARDSAG